MALEWVGKGVRVNCVAPGIIYTESGFANYGYVYLVLYSVSLC